jgi:hypothetical protein
MDMLDDPDRYPDSNVSQVAEKRFQEYYLRPLGNGVRYVRLQSMLQGLGARCQGRMLIFFDRNAHER